MRIEFDQARDEANQAKHGVSLLMAVELDCAKDHQPSPRQSS
jgi:uncharacterized DUF497 family protein